MVSEDFKKNVESGDFITIRSALVDYLIIDTTFRRFDEALDYAKQLIDIIEADDGKAYYDLDQEHWNETYLNKQKVALMVNFSQKRIDHIKLVIKNVLADNSDSVQNSDIVKETSYVKPQGNRTGRRTTGKKSSRVNITKEDVSQKNMAALIIGGGIAAAAIGGLTAVVGLIAAKPAVIHTGEVIAGIGCVVAVSGGVMKTVKEM